MKYDRESLAQRPGGLLGHAKLMLGLRALEFFVQGFVSLVWAALESPDNVALWGEVFSLLNRNSELAEPFNEALRQSLRLEKAHERSELFYKVLLDTKEATVEEGGWLSVGKSPAGKFLFRQCVIDMVLAADRMDKEFWNTIFRRVRNNISLLPEDILSALTDRAPFENHKTFLAKQARQMEEAGDDSALRGSSFMKDSVKERAARAANLAKRAKGSQDLRSLRTAGTKSSGGGLRVGDKTTITNPATIRRRERAHALAAARRNK